MAASETGRYGTFPQDKQDTEFEWEGVAAPWMLLASCAGFIGRNLAALFVLFWTLLRGDAARKNLMPCNPELLSTPAVYGCEYTKAFLRAFPLLGISVTLAIGMRLILQQRAYYGFLKSGGLLDFKNVEGYRDPLLLALLVSLLHAIAHFCLKLADGQGDFLAELQQIATNFVVPYLVFLAFLYSSNDIEKMLVPLSKYYEEDPEYARRALQAIAYLREEVVRRDVLSRDVVGAALEDAPTIEAVYREIIRGYPAALAAMPSDEKEPFLQFHLHNSMWSAPVLIDDRLQDERSGQFRLVFKIFLGVCSLVQIIVFLMFFEQAIVKDLYGDYWVEGQNADVMGTIVMLAHAAVVGGVLHGTLWPVIFSAAGQEARRVAEQAERVAEEAKRVAEQAKAKVSGGMPAHQRSGHLES